MEASSHQHNSSSTFFLPWLISNLPLLLLTFTTILFLLKHYKRPKKPTTTTALPPPPPGPRKLPIIGNLHQLALNRRLAELARRHGPDVMHLQLGQLSHVIISTPEAAKQVMKTHDFAFASRPFLLAPSVLYGGCNDVAFAPYGHHWRQLRKICTLELLSTKRVQSFRWIRGQEVDKLVLDLRRASADASGVVDLSRMVEKLSAAVISRALFGTIRGLNQAFLTVADNISDVLSGFRMSDLYPSLTFLPVLSGFEGKLKSMREGASSILDAIIDERRSEGGEEEEEEDYLVDVLLKIQENPDQVGLTVTTEIIKAVTLELFLAGGHTSANLIEWTMSEMMKQPRVMQKAQDEVRQAFDEKGDVDEVGLHGLEYLDCVVKEGLRLHPPGPLLLPRESREDAKLCGYMVPVGTKVVVNAWAIGRDPRYWSDAEEFYPERFVDCSIDYKGNDFQFVPFGAGRRMCPGYGFGIEVVKLTLANLLFHFSWRLPGDSRPESLDMTETVGASIARKYPLRVIPVPYRP
ncbi:unnamed protein product [Linum tenue]|uniref:Cytochrome P450 n=1 Tax=Linum tenue TaxID=586396 RepID=A0AAV0Q852_9ROSI|nr:unnamed protein product [Linum tenue]